MATKSGKIYSVKRKKFLSQFGNGHGYRRVHIWKDGEFKRRPVHNIMADTFLKRVEGKEIVNHKNGDKEDNRLSNLEMVSSSENRIHYESLRKKRA